MSTSEPQPSGGQPERTPPGGQPEGGASGDDVPPPAPPAPTADPSAEIPPAATPSPAAGQPPPAPPTPPPASAAPAPPPPAPPPPPPADTLTGQMPAAGPASSPAAATGQVPSMAAPTAPPLASPPPPTGQVPPMVPPTEAAPRPPQGPAEAPAAGRRARRAVPRWVGLVTNLGLALAAVVGIQLLAALLEGLSMGIGQLASLPTADRLHRLGYAFSANFGMPAPLTLVVAVVLVSLPVLVGQRTRESQEQNAILTLWLVVVEAVLIGLGSLLAVRYNLARLAAQGAVFPFARVELSIFLAGVLGVSTVAAVAALVGRQIREPHR